MATWAWNYDGNERKVKRKTENQGKPRKMKVGSMGLWWKTAKTWAAMQEILAQEKGKQEKGKLSSMLSFHIFVVLCLTPTVENNTYKLLM